MRLTRCRVLRLLYGLKWFERQPSIAYRNIQRKDHHDMKVRITLITRIRCLPCSTVGSSALIAMYDMNVSMSGHARLAMNSILIVLEQP